MLACWGCFAGMELWMLWADSSLIHCQIRPPHSNQRCHVSVANDALIPAAQFMPFVICAAVQLLLPHEFHHMVHFIYAPSLFDVSLILLLGIRVYSQLLLVLDDTDLHTRQAPFTLAATRAITTTLNSLVFHTFFPQEQQQQQQQQASSKQEAGLQAFNQASWPTLDAATLAAGQVRRCIVLCMGSKCVLFCIYLAARHILTG